MEKINIELKKREYISFTFLKNDILVNPYIDVRNKTMFIRGYITSITAATDAVSGYLEAEYGLKLGIIELMTNIDIANVDLGEVICSGLWDEIQTRIVNFQELRGDINSILEKMEKSDSVVSTINIFVKKLNLLLDEVKKLDLSQEGITELLGRFNAELDKLNHIGELEVPILPPAEKKITKPRVKKTKELLQ